MVRKLEVSVWVDEVRYGPDKPVPDDVAKKITNPDVWADDDTDTNADDQADTNREPTAPGTPPKPESPQVTTDPSSGDGGGQADADGDGDGTTARPAGNASREAWATYASKREIDVTGQMGRDEIKAAVEQLDAQQAAARQGE